MSYEFADRLIELRRAKGLSQEELAGELGLSRQAVSKWERAESAPDIGNLVALSKLYGVSLDDLVQGADSEGANGAVAVEEAEAIAEAAEVAESAEVPSGETTVVETAEAVEATEPIMDEAQPASSAGYESAPTTTAYEQAYEQAVPQPKSPHTSRAWQIFPYPLLCVIIFLFLGFFFGMWHPAWIIFLTIPFYYWIVRLILHDPLYRAAHQGTEAQDD